MGNAITPEVVNGIYQPVTDTRRLGPAMTALEPKQRAFVLALVDTGGQDATKAARMAGYGGENPQSVRVTAHRLTHDAKVLEAIREVADSRIRSEALMAMEVIVEIAKDVTHKDRFAAAKEIANRSGLMVVNKVEHAHVHRTEDEDEKIKRIIQLAKGLGVDPRTLLGSAGVTLDAEFEVVQSVALPAPGSAEGLEDLL